MIVEVVGGPKDGEVYEVPDGMREITFPILGDDLWNVMEEDAEPRAVGIRTLVLPIWSRYDGRRIVVWREI